MSPLPKKPGSNPVRPASGRRLARDPAAGFSLVELLVTVGIGAAILASAVIIYTAIASARSTADSFGAVTIGAAALDNFYAETGTRIRTYFAPNYGRAARAEILRERLLEDIRASSAVFVLSRNLLNVYRPDTIAIPAGTAVEDLDTPENFRQFLAAVQPATAPVFLSYRGAAPGRNATIFLLRPSGDRSEFWLRAVYELDFVDSNDPAGTYACVRRYVGGTLVDFYDVFFPTGGGSAQFLPVVASFERRALRSTIETAPIDAFKQAANAPFYFLWWPDPAARFLNGAPGPTHPSTDPRHYYAAMGGRTSLFFVVPMFPSL